jgi:hypothetical protein
MTFAELKAEFAERGFNHFSSARQGRFINAAYLRLVTLECWPFRESSATGTSPLAISDLGVIEAVINTDTNTLLEPAQWVDLVQSYGDLSTTGTSIAYYVAQPGGAAREVVTYPAGGSIGVQYWRVPSEMSADADVPIVPAEYQGLIVDMAVARAYPDSDEAQSAVALEADIQRQLLEMRNDLLTLQRQAADTFIPAIGDDN